MKPIHYATWKPKQFMEEPCEEVPMSLVQRLVELPGIWMSILKADPPAPNKATPDRNTWNKDELFSLGSDKLDSWTMEITAVVLSH